MKHSVGSGRSRESSLHQLTLSWSHLPIGIRHLSRHSYKSSIQYCSAAFCLLRSKLPSSIPNSSFRHSQDLAFWYSFLNQTPLSWVICYTYISLSTLIISALFCSVNPRGGIIIAALPAHSWQAAWMGREFLPRTEPYRQTKLYAKCLSFWR